MAVVEDAYCETTDLLIGDIPLPMRHGDGTAMIKAAAEEIDAHIGHLYVTPVELNDTPEFRPTRLLLKKINNYIASGRLLLDMAAGGEDSETHAYGMSLLREGIDLLNKVASGQINLQDVDRIDGESAPTRLFILQEDSHSLVESFYKNNQTALASPPVPFYGER